MGTRLTKLTLENLDEFKGGILTRMSDKYLAIIAHDLLAAPDVPEARKLNIQVTCKPRKAEDGSLDDVIVEFSMNHTLPKRCTTGTMKVQTKDGKRGLYHNVDSPDVPDQVPLPFQPANA